MAAIPGPPLAGQQREELSSMQVRSLGRRTRAAVKTRFRTYLRELTAGRFGLQVQLQRFDQAFTSVKGLESFAAGHPHGLSCRFDCRDPQLTRFQTGQFSSPGHRHAEPASFGLNRVFFLDPVVETAGHRIMGIEFFRLAGQADERWLPIACDRA